MTFEERTRTVTNEEGGQYGEVYQASFVITDKVELFERIKDHYGVEVTYEQQANAMNVWHIAKYNTTVMQEGMRLMMTGQTGMAAVTLPIMTCLQAKWVERWWNLPCPGWAFHSEGQ